MAENCGFLKCKPFYCLRFHRITSAHGKSSVHEAGNCWIALRPPAWSNSLGRHLWYFHQRRLCASRLKCWESSQRCVSINTDTDWKTPRTCKMRKKLTFNFTNKRNQTARGTGPEFWWGGNKKKKRIRVFNCWSQGQVDSSLAMTRQDRHSWILPPTFLKKVHCPFCRIRAGCTALPPLLNIKQAMQQSQCSGVWSAKDELPVSEACFFCLHLELSKEHTCAFIYRSPADSVPLHSIPSPSTQHRPNIVNTLDLYPAPELTHCHLAAGGGAVEQLFKAGPSSILFLLQQMHRWRLTWVRNVDITPSSLVRFCGNRATTPTLQCDWFVVMWSPVMRSTNSPMETSKLCVCVCVPASVSIVWWCWLTNAILVTTLVSCH